MKPIHEIYIDIDYKTEQRTLHDLRSIKIYIYININIIIILLTIAYTFKLDCKMRSSLFN